MSHEITPLNVRPLNTFLETHTVLHCDYINSSNHWILITLHKPNIAVLRELITILLALPFPVWVRDFNKQPHIVMQLEHWNLVAEALGKPTLIREPRWTPGTFAIPANQADDGSRWTIVHTTELDTGVKTSKIGSAADLPRSSTCILL